MDTRLLKIREMKRFCKWVNTRNVAQLSQYSTMAEILHRTQLVQDYSRHKYFTLPSGIAKALGCGQSAGRFQRNVVTHSFRVGAPAVLRETGI